MFLLSKIGGVLLLPSNVIALFCAAGIVLLIAGRRRAGLWLAGTGVGALLVFGFTPVGTVMMLTLSERFPAWQPAGPPPAGIIVLGGAIDPDISAARGDVELASGAERIVAALTLARRFPQARIVFSGGSARLLPGGVAEATIVARLFEEFGVEAERLILESRSRTTAENARFSRDLVKPRAGERWLLVTSAFHMPRAIGAFRAAGFVAEAYPVDWRTRGWVDALQPFDRLSAGLGRSDSSVREWIGLVVYRLTGRSTALFPAP